MYYRCVVLKEQKLQGYTSMHTLTLHSQYPGCYNTYHSTFHKQRKLRYHMSPADRSAFDYQHSWGSSKTQFSQRTCFWALGCILLFLLFFVVDFTSSVNLCPVFYFHKFYLTICFHFFLSRLPQQSLNLSFLYSLLAPICPLYYRQQYF